MWGMNIAVANVADTLKDTVKGETYCGRGERLLLAMDGGRRDGDSLVPLPGSGDSRILVSAAAQ